MYVLVLLVTMVTCPQLHRRAAYFLVVTSILAAKAVDSQTEAQIKETGNEGSLSANEEESLKAMDQGGI